MLRADIIDFAIVGEALDEVLVIEINPVRSAPALLDHSVDLDLEPAMLDFTSRFGDSCPVLNDCRCVCL